ncbi:MAG: FxsA family protein [Candidatus Nanohalobium sp.]
MLRYLAVTLLMLPFVDLYLLVAAAGFFGFWKTLAAVLLTGLVGAELIRREGLHILKKLQMSVTGGEISRNVLEGGLLVLAGLFLLTPGFVTDVMGFAIVLRPIRERAVAHVMNRAGGNFQVEVQRF